VTQDQLIHVHVVLVYCLSMVDREAIRQRWELFGSKLDERGQRHFAAVEAMTARARRRRRRAQDYRHRALYDRAWPR
jgi:hypothetical protein